MKHFLLIITATIICLQCLALGSNKPDSSKKIYQAAKQQIENMLDGKAPASYENAIYLVENAWYDGKLGKQNFTNQISQDEASILQLILANWHPPVLDSAALPTEQENQAMLYAQAVANWAIYKYMTDTIHFKTNTDTSLLSPPCEGVIARFVPKQSPEASSQAKPSMYLHLPMQYSTADPLGSIDWKNTQINNLRKTHTGNCFALASFFKILSDRLGTAAMLCTAPGHIYIRHANDKGIFYNVELGGRDFPGTGTLSTLTYSTAEAIKNNIALRELTNKQAIALTLVYLAKGYQHKYGCGKADAFLLSCANATLKNDDHNLNALLLKAQVLEARLAMQHSPIKKLQTNPCFISYQQLIANLYHLGYRQMPDSLKNLLVATHTVDSIRQLQTQAYTAQTHYASLSWGMMDEAHLARPTEQYGHTIFNPITKKITAFAPPQNSLDGYQFDNVVFGWNVDPLTGKLPNWSPYVGLGDNPELNIDPNGALFFGLFGSTSEQRKSAEYQAGVNHGNIKDKWKRDIHVNYTTTYTNSNNDAVAVGNSTYFLKDGRTASKAYLNWYYDGGGKNTSLVRAAEAMDITKKWMKLPSEVSEGLYLDGWGNPHSVGKQSPALIFVYPEPFFCHCQNWDYWERQVGWQKKQWLRQKLLLGQN